MEPRLDLITNQIGAQIAKRIYNVSLVIDQSPRAPGTLRLDETVTAHVWHPPIRPTPIRPTPFRPA